MGDYGSALTNASLKNYNLKTGLFGVANLGLDASPIELISAGKNSQLVIWKRILVCLTEKIHFGICTRFSPDSDFSCPFQFHYACAKLCFGYG